MEKNQFKISIFSENDIFADFLNLNSKLSRIFSEKWEIQKKIGNCFLSSICIQHFS